MEDRGGNIISRRTVLGFFASGTAALLAGCGLLGGIGYRFKMIVEVETPQGVKTASSVYQVTARKLTAFTAEEAVQTAYERGEATVIDLQNGPFFVLMKTKIGSANDLAQVSMILDEQYNKPNSGGWPEMAKRISQSWSTLRREVPREKWPVIVRFRNLNDPTSVEEVDPQAIGVKRISLETTNEDVTTGIERRLPWLVGRDQRSPFAKRLSMIGPTQPPIAALLSPHDFSTELGK